MQRFSIIFSEKYCCFQAVSKATPRQRNNAKTWSENGVLTHSLLVMFQETIIWF